MMKRLVKEIALMVVLIVMGIFDLLIGLNCSKWWLGTLDIAASLLAFFVAWLCYRDAQKIAEVIDEPSKLTITIIRYGEESESKGKIQEQAEKSVETETDREDESEDYCAHPI